jgi:hypothetical protein
MRTIVVAEMVDLVLHVPVSVSVVILSVRV